MPPRHSCDRCRLQKVRCLRDETCSVAQPLSPCQRCTKAGVDCVYSLRQSARRFNEGNTSTGEDSTTSGLDMGLDACFSQPDALDTRFADLNAQLSSIGDGADPCFNHWDTSMDMFAEGSPLGVAAAPEDPSRDHSLGVGSSDNQNEDNPVEYIITQLDALGRRAIRATTELAHFSLPLTVSSPHINEVLEDTNTLIRIINKLTASPEPNPFGSTVDYGLIFLTLATHQRILSLFGAICDCIDRSLQAMAFVNDGHRPGPHEDAQFVMITQLMMHLVNRIDQSIFQNRPSSRSRPVTPITPSTQMQPYPEDHNSVMGPGPLITLAGSIVGTIHTQHAKLKFKMQELQMHIERFEFA